MKISFLHFNACSPVFLFLTFQSFVSQEQCLNKLFIVLAAGKDNGEGPAPTEQTQLNLCAAYK